MTSSLKKVHINTADIVLGRKHVFEINNPLTVVDDENGNKKTKGDSAGGHIIVHILPVNDKNVSLLQ